MKLAYLIILSLTFMVLLTPVYLERHVLTNTLRGSFRDCYTGLNGQTTCTSEDIAAFIGFAGIAVVSGGLLLLVSIGISYLIARRFGLV